MVSRRPREQWARCKSGALGRRKSAVEDLLDDLRMLIDESLRGSVFVPSAEAMPLMRFARMGAIRCLDAGQDQAAWRFFSAMDDVRSVDDIGHRQPAWATNCPGHLGTWPPFRSEWSPGYFAESGCHLGIIVTQDALHTLIAAARYWASRHWPGITAPLDPPGLPRCIEGQRRPRMNGTCGAPPLPRCTPGRVRACDAHGSRWVASTGGWSC